MIRCSAFPPARRAFAADRRGGVAITFALSAIPLVIAVGAAVEYARVTALRATLQNVTDAAALDVVTYLAQQAKAGATPTTMTVADKFNTALQARMPETGLSFGAGKGAIVTPTTGDISFAANATQVSFDAKTAANVPAAFGSLFSISNYRLHASAGVQQRFISYANVTLALDVSPSMAVAATAAEIARLESLTRTATGTACAYACHDVSNGFNNYTIARNGGVQLRIDLVKSGSLGLVNYIASKQRTSGQTTVGLVTFGGLATQNLAPTSNLTSVTDALSRVDFHQMSTVAPTLPDPAAANMATGTLADHYGDTDYQALFSKLETVIPANGSGVSW